MSYVDGYVLPVPKKNLKAYVKMAKKAERLWRKCGALDYKECVGDDLNTECGMPFAKLVRPKAGETVFFSFIVFRSRAHRDAVNRRVMKEISKVGCTPENVPFDLKRMGYGGFKTVVGP